MLNEPAFMPDRMDDSSGMTRNWMPLLAGLPPQYDVLAVRSSSWPCFQVFHWYGPVPSGLLSTVPALMSAADRIEVPVYDSAVSSDASGTLSASVRVCGSVAV